MKTETTKPHNPHIVITIDGLVVFDSNAPGGAITQDSGSNPPPPPPGHP
jgi:hypothetical protein